MKSTLLNMTAVLFGITLVASAGVGLVNKITIEPIAVAKQAAQVEALKGVLPEFDDTTLAELMVDEMPITVYTATKGGETVGYAVQSMTKQGFSGVIRLMVGFAPTGEVINVNVLEQTETPGLGTKMADEGNSLLAGIQGQQLEQKKLVDGKLAVTKDGGDVDALTAATISSRAYVDAINRAWMAYKSVALGVAPTDVASGATNAAAASGTAEQTCACGKEKCEGCTGECGGEGCLKNCKRGSETQTRGRENRQERGLNRDKQGANAQEGGQNE